MGDRLRAVIRGRVQGVGYRWFAQARGAALGLSGGVRNLANGSVEVICEGDRGQINQLLGLLREGPFGAEVRDIEEIWQSATGEFKSFDIWPSV